MNDANIDGGDDDQGWSRAKAGARIRVYWFIECSSASLILRAQAKRERCCCAKRRWEQNYTPRYLAAMLCSNIIIMRAGIACEHLRWWRINSGDDEQERKWHYYYARSTCDVKQFYDDNMTCNECIVTWNVWNAMFDALHVMSGCVTWSK